MPYSHQVSLQPSLSLAPPSVPPKSSPRSSKLSEEEIIAMFSKLLDRLDFRGSRREEMLRMDTSGKMQFIRAYQRKQQLDQEKAKARVPAVVSQPSFLQNVLSSPSMQTIDQLNGRDLDLVYGEVLV
eukprot:jgi/Hompol1/4718/HPOL_001813-RA